MAQPGRRTTSSVIVLGIDPGLSCTGWGVVLQEGSTHRLIDFGAISPPSRASHPEKLVRIHEALSDVIRRTNPREVAIEDFIIGHTRAAVAIAEARAAAVLAAALAGLPVTLYKPTEVKQFVATYGSASKEQVAMMVKALLSLTNTPQPSDASDALAIALCHCLKRGADNYIAELGAPANIPSIRSVRGATR